MNHFKQILLFLSFIGNFALAMNESKLLYQAFCKAQKKFWNKKQWDLTLPSKKFPKKREKYFEKVEHQENKIWGLLLWLETNNIDLSALHAQTTKSIHDNPNNDELYRNLIVLNFIIDNHILDLYRLMYTSRWGTKMFLNYLDIDLNQNKSCYGITDFINVIAKANQNELRQALQEKSYTKVLQDKRNFSYIQKLGDCMHKAEIDDFYQK